MQALATHNSAAKICRVQHHWWNRHVVFVCILALIVLPFLFGLQANSSTPASRASNDPPWPAPIGMHVVGSFSSFGE